MDIKLGVAGAGALAGVAIAAWVAMGQVGGGGAVRSAASGWEARRSAPAGAPGEGAAGPGRASDVAPDAGDGAGRIAVPAEPGRPAGPAWAEPLKAPEGGWRFAPAGNAGLAFDLGSGAVEEQVTRNGELGALEGASRLGLVESWRRFVRPILADDPGAFAAAAVALGGAVSEADGGEGPVSQLFGRLSGLLAGASIDWGAASSRRADASDLRDVPRMPRMAGVSFGGHAPMMVMVLANEENGVRTERRAVSVPLQPLFPGAERAAEAGAPVVEVWVPAALAGSARTAPDAGVATFLVWEAERRGWSPLAMRITLETPEAERAFERAREGGRP